MRVFVAVLPPPGVLDAVVAAGERLRAAVPGSWVPRERLHLTLAFLGEVADPAPFGAALAEAIAATPPMTLRVEGGGAFPRPARARVLWAGVTGDTEALARLARLTRRTARAHRIDVERAPYVPHLTLARLRGRPADVTTAVGVLAALRSGEWQVGEVAVMRSTLGPTPVYEPLRRCPLGYQA